MIHRAYILGCGFLNILIFCSECIWIEYPVPYGPYSVGPIPDPFPSISIRTLINKNIITINGWCSKLSKTPPNGPSSIRHNRSWN